METEQMLVDWLSLMRKCWHTYTVFTNNWLIDPTKTSVESHGYGDVCLQAGGRADIYIQQVLFEPVQSFFTIGHFAEREVRGIVGQLVAVTQAACGRLLIMCFSPF